MVYDFFIDEFVEILEFVVRRVDRFVIDYRVIGFVLFDLLLLLVGMR